MEIFAIISSFVVITSPVYFLLIRIERRLTRIEVNCQHCDSNLKKGGLHGK